MFASVMAWPGAIAQHDKAIELNPEDPYFFVNRGRAKDEQGDADGALADYGKSIELDPHSRAAALAHSTPASSAR